MNKIAFILFPALATCAVAATEQQPRSARAETRLGRVLSGKMAGVPRRCISRLRINDLEIVDSNTILYKYGRDLAYRNDPKGGCPGLDPTRTIVTQSPSSDLCRGDFIRVVDRTTGSTVGSCSFSDFVPYSRRGSDGS